MVMLDIHFNKNQTLTKHIEICNDSILNNFFFFKFNKYHSVYYY